MSERQFCPNHYRVPQNPWITEVWRDLWSLSNLISPAHSMVSYTRFLRILSSSILNISKDGNRNLSGQPVSMLGRPNRKERKEKREREEREEGKRWGKASRQGGWKEGNFPAFNLCQLLLIGQLLAGRAWDTEKVIQNFIEC